MKVFAIVPVRNRRDITRDFLRCVSTQTYMNVETIVIDDGSTDGTPEMITAEFPAVACIRGDGDLYWTGAVNVGLHHALARAGEDDRILVINDDLEFPPDYIEKLVRLSQTNERAIIGSVVVDITTPDIISDGGRIINWWTAKMELLHKGVSLEQFGGKTFPVSTLTGRGVIFPAEVFRRIGLYDEKRFRHRGDTELPVRAAKAGYSLLVSYDAVVKSYVDKTYGIDIAQRYTFADFRKFFFDIKSSGNVIFRFNFARCTRRNVFQFTSYLVCDLTRVAFHFFSRLGPLGTSY